MAEGARLESVYTLIAYRGFESLSLRQIKENRLRAVFFWRREGSENLIPPVQPIHPLAHPFVHGVIGHQQRFGIGQEVEHGQLGVVNDLYVS